jgi:hypothetical protein
MESLNPLDVRPGCIVALKRGQRADSSLMPVVSPVAGGDNARASAAALRDKGGDPAQIAQLEADAAVADAASDPQPTGECLSVRDARGGVPVRWARDLSWSVCRIEQLELVQRAPDAPADPVSELQQLKEQNELLKKRLDDLGGDDARIGLAVANALRAAGIDPDRVTAAENAHKA